MCVITIVSDMCLHRVKRVGLFVAQRLWFICASSSWVRIAPSRRKNDELQKRGKKENKTRVETKLKNENQIVPTHHCRRRRRRRHRTHTEQNRKCVTHFRTVNVETKLFLFLFSFFSVAGSTRKKKISIGSFLVSPQLQRASCGNPEHTGNPQ